jgi:hypothetical protein
MVMKFNPQGLVTMVLGRRTSGRLSQRFLERTQGRSGGGHRAGIGRRPRRFGRPTDVAFDPQRTSSSPAATNSRVAKFNKDGDFVKSIGTRGARAVQRRTPSPTTPGQHLRRRPRQPADQVFDSDLNRSA